MVDAIFNSTKETEFIIQAENVNAIVFIFSVFMSRIVERNYITNQIQSMDRRNVFHLPGHGSFSCDILLGIVFLKHKKIKTQIRNIKR